MGKPGSGGGGGASLFTSNITGPAPGPYAAGSSEWIDLGAVPTGNRLWFGNAQYASVDKTMSFELRVNKSGESAGSEGSTDMLGATTASAKSGTVFADFYRKGRLHTMSGVGTGVERFWLRLKAKSASAGSYYYAINYTLE